MKAGETIMELQALLGIPKAKRAPKWGPISRARIAYLLSLDPDAEVGDFAAADAQAGRDISADGLDLVRHFESCFLKAYQDEVGVWTIGWGHTGLQHNDGTVFKGRVITQEKAVELLQYDMNQFEAVVSSLVKVELNDDEFAALVSFAFNLGEGTLASSTLLKRLNADPGRDPKTRLFVADQFLRFNHADGQVLRGLTRRRKSERNLFLGTRPFIVE